MEPSASRPTRQKSTTSRYLQYFHIDSNKCRKCKFCGKVYGATTSTSNLSSHLKARHPGYDNAAGISTSSAAAAGVTSTAAAGVRLPKPGNINWMLVKWLVQSLRDPSILDELRPTLQVLNPTVKIWPIDKFPKVIQEVFQNMRNEVNVIVDEVSSKICLTIDFWKSLEKFQFMSITAHWIDANWCLQTVLLDVCHIDRRCWSEVSRVLVEVISGYNINNKVICCTYGRLKEDMGYNDNSQCYYFPCVSHTLNSMVNDVLSHSESMICKTREVVRRMNASSDLSADFQLSCDVYGEDKWEFPLDVSSRWSGKFQMIEIARKAIKSIGIIIQNNVDLENRLQLSRMEKNDVNITYAYLEHFSESIKDMCTNRVLTVGLAFLFMDYLLSNVILPCQVHENYPTWLTDAAKNMATKAQSYNAKVFNGFTYMSAILDPRIKLKYLPERLNSVKYFKEAKSHYVRNYSTSGAEGIVTFREMVTRRKGNIGMEHGSTSSAKDDLTRYLSEPPMEMSTDVLEWWKMKSTSYPRLSVMARDFLAVQATSLAPEDLFCSKGDKIDKQRLTTPYESTQALHCVKSWMQSKIKLKYRSTEIDYENLGGTMSAGAAATIDILDALDST